MVRVLLFEGFPVEAEPEQKQLDLQAGAAAYNRITHAQHALARIFPSAPFWKA
jgi:hypothetical protein